MTTPIRISPLAATHHKLGATIANEAGWEVVSSYAGEPGLASTPVAIADITPRGKVDVRGGPPAWAGAGAITADITDDWGLVFGGPGAEAELLRKLEQAAGDEVLVTDATHVYVGFAILGPGLDAAVERLTAFDASSLAPDSAAAAPFLDVPAIFLRRDLALPTMEVYLGCEYAAYAWSGLSATVASAGGGPVGWEALRNAGWR